MSRIVSQSAQDHFDSRAAPAYSAFLRLKSRENTIAAAVAFWEMRDQLRGSTGKAEFDQALFKSCPELKFIRDIAEASKHAELASLTASYFGARVSQHSLRNKDIAARFL